VPFPADWWFDLRNRLLADPRLQRWAARFPLTRPIARRRASALFDVCAGFVYSQILAAVVELDVLAVLAAGPRTVDHVAREVDLPRDSAERLLDAASSLGLVERRARGRYGVGTLGAALLGNPAVTTMVRHHALLYRDLASPVDLLRKPGAGTELRRFWAYGSSGLAAGPSEESARYSALMSASLSLVAYDVIEAYPPARHRRLLDVGGGEGAFLEIVATHAPRTALELFDLPPVAALAKERLERAGLGARVAVIAGDAFRDPLPTGADLISLVRVLHDHDDEAALALLRAVRRALPANGTVMIAEPMAGMKGAEQVGHAYFGFYLLAMGQGRPRSPDSIASLLRRAGFLRVDVLPTRRPLLTGLVVAGCRATSSVKSS
jgi:demethylspheroidene O-methyltransferase